MKQNTKVVPIAEVSQTDPYSNVDPLLAFLKQSGLTQKELARRLEYSPTAISQYLKCNYAQGDVAGLNARVGEFLAAEAVYAKYTPVVSATAMTTQVRQVYAAIEYVVRHKSFGVIVGEAGLGKTQGLKEYARQNRHQTILLTLNPLTRSKTAFVQHLWINLPGCSRGNRLTMPKAMLLLDDIIQFFRNKHKTVLIDEAQFLDMHALETARSIQDQTGIGFVLAGTFDLDEELGFIGKHLENEQLPSRVRIHRKLTPEMSKTDIASITRLYGTDDPVVVDWFFRRANRSRRRYRWMAAILNAARDICVDRHCELSVAILEEAEGVTQLP